MPRTGLSVRNLSTKQGTNPVSKHLINSIGLALIAAGQSMVASAAGISENLEGVLLTVGDASGGVSPTFVATVELDKQGLPWDERIHAGTKNKTQEGVWIKKKGVQETTMAAVVAELRQKYPAPTSDTSGANTTPTGGLTMPNMPVIATTPYQKLCAWVAANTGDGKKIDAAGLEAIFTSNNTSLAALKDADPALVTQWLESLTSYHASLA